MKRPCFLVIDREYSGSISTRKLVIETAKFNVITAYSGEEAIETLGRFPNIDGIVIDAGIKDVPCSKLLQQLRALHLGVPLIVIDTPWAEECPGATHYLKSFEPAKLLELLKKIDPEPTEQIEKQNELLAKTQDYPERPK